MKRKIEGVVFFDCQTKQMNFSGTFRKSFFDDGVWKAEYSTYIFIAEHSIELDMPDDFDIIGPQLAVLDDKENELNLQYKQAIKQIKCERNSLLALEG